MWRRRCCGNVNSWELILPPRCSLLWCSSTPSEWFNITLFFTASYSVNHLFIQNLFLNKSNTIQSALIDKMTENGEKLHWCTHLVFCSHDTLNILLQVFPPEDGGAASKSGLFQSAETHEEESQQPQRQEHQHPVPEVHGALHRPER